MFSRENLPHEPLALPDRMDLKDVESLTRARDWFDFMSRRHSVRDFSDQPVPRAVIETAVATAGRAPSGANHQPWHFVAISDPAMKRRIRDVAEEEERRRKNSTRAAVATNGSRRSNPSAPTLRNRTSPLAPGSS